MIAIAGAVILSIAFGTLLIVSAALAAHARVVQRFHARRYHA